MLIRHFYNELRQMIIYEIDINEVENIQPRAKIIPFYRYASDNKQIVIFYFDAEYFLLNKTFKVLKRLDAYGSTMYEVDNKSVILLNTYGEEDNALEYFLDSKVVSVFTICIIYDNIVEVADVVNSKSILPRKKLELRNYMYAELPKELQGADFSGKRAFYFYRKDSLLSLRIKQDIYTKLPESLKHIEAENWVSGPRTLIKLKSVDF